MNILRMQVSYGEILKKLLKTIASNVAGYHPDNLYTENRGILNRYRQSLNDQNYLRVSDEEKFNYQLVHWPIARVIILKPGEHGLPELTHPAQKVNKVV